MLGSQFIRNVNRSKKNYVPEKKLKQYKQADQQVDSSDTVLHKGPSNGGHGNEVVGAITKRQVTSFKVQKALSPALVPANVRVWFLRDIRVS